MPLSDQEVYEAMAVMIAGDGWQHVVIPAMVKQYQSTLAQLTTTKDHGDIRELIGQLKTLRFFLDAATNNQRLLDRLNAHRIENEPQAQWAAGSPYDKPRQV